MNLKALALTALAATTLGFGTAPKAEASTPRAGLREAQYTLCVTGRTYRQHVENGYMSQSMASKATARNTLKLQNENGWGAETNTALVNAATFGYSGGQCGYYL